VGQARDSEARELLSELGVPRVGRRSSTWSTPRSRRTNCATSTRSTRAAGRPGEELGRRAL